MLKKLFIVFAVIIGIVVLVVAALFISSWTSRPKTDKEFLSQLKGEVVFTRDIKGQGSEILKYSFNDQKIATVYQCDGVCDYPKWSEDGKNIIFYKPNNDMTDSIYQLTSIGTDLQLVGNIKLSAEDIYPRVEGINIKSGDLFMVTNGQEKLIYDAKYDGKFNTGVSYVSWSPDKKYLIFVDNRYTIYITDTNGNISKLTIGSAPNWKY